jgi:O-antigen/teichoic acid export membrane protein
MGTDYFPRLAGINNDREKMETLVNQQAEIAILILGPLLICLIGFVPLVVKMFYVSSFLPISGMIKWNMLGMLFKAASWSIAFVIVAKGHSKLFFMQDLILNIVILILNVVGYSIWRLDGIGISFFISYILYFILVIVLVYKYYLVKFRPIFWKLFIIQLGLTFLAFLISYMENRILVYGLIVALFMLSAGYSLYELNKKIELKALVNKILKK